MGRHSGRMTVSQCAVRADRRPLRLIIAWLLASFHGMAPGMSGAKTGGGEQPFVDRVAGNCYERRVLDAEGGVTGHQLIRVRDTDHGPNGPVVPIDVVKLRTGEPPDGEQRVEDRYEFKLLGDVADDAQEEATLQIVGYLGSGSRVTLDFLDHTVIYPAQPCDGQTLPPVRLDLSARGGLVDLLGGRAEIRITDRICRPAGEGESYYIEGDLRLKVYLLGIRFKNQRYRSRQLVDGRRGLVRHVLDEPGGGRQELAMVENAGCMPR